VFLDEWLRDTAARDRFLMLLAAATEQLLRDGVFTQSGQQWVSEVMGELRERIVGGDV
jgi:hypothetical protein